MKSFEEWKKGQSSNTSSPVSGSTISFDQWKKKKQEAGVDYGKILYPAQTVKPAESGAGQLKPVDQVEHEQSYSMIDKSKSVGLGFLKSGVSGIANIGTAVRSTGRAMQIDGENKDSMAGKVLRSAAHILSPSFGAASDVKRAFDATGATRKVNEFAGPLLEKAGSSVEKTYGDTAEKIGKDPAYIEDMSGFRGKDGSYDPKKFRDPWVYLQTITEGVGSFIPGAAAGMATKNPYAAGAVMGLMEKGDAVSQYEQAYSEQTGKSPADFSDSDRKRIDNAANMYGAVSAVLESAFPGLLGRIIKGGKGKFLVEVAKSIPFEGGTEGLQRFAQNLIGKVSGLNEDQVLSEGVLDEAIAGALTGVAVTAPTTAFSPRIKDNIVPSSGNGKAPEDPPKDPFNQPVHVQAPDFNTRPSIKEFVSALQSGDDAQTESVASKMSHQDLVDAQKVLGAIKNDPEATPEHLASVEEISQVVDGLIEDSRGNIAGEAERIISGTPKEEGASAVSIIDQQKIKDVLEQAKADMTPEQVAEVEQRIAAELDTQTLPEAKSRSIDGNPFVETSTKEEIDAKYSESKAKRDERMTELDQAKSDLLAKKTETTDPVAKKELQDAINVLDTERHQIEDAGKKDERHAIGQQAELAQRAIDQIRALNPDFDVVESVKNGWKLSDYRTELDRIKEENPQKVVEAEAESRRKQAIRDEIISKAEKKISETENGEPEKVEKPVTEGAKTVITPKAEVISGSKNSEVKNTEYNKRTNDLLESYARGEEKVKKLEDMQSVVDAQDDPKKFKEIGDLIAKEEEGNKSAIKQLAEHHNLSDYEIIDVISTYIDAGKKRGGRTLDDFYKFLPKPENTGLIVDANKKVEPEKKSTVVSKKSGLQISPNFVEEAKELRKELDIMKKEEEKILKSPERLAAAKELAKRERSTVVSKKSPDSYEGYSVGDKVAFDGKEHVITSILKRDEGAKFELTIGDKTIWTNKEGLEEKKTTTGSLFAPPVGEKTTRKSTVVTTKKSDTSAETAAKIKKASVSMKALMKEGYQEDDDGDTWTSEKIDGLAAIADDDLRSIGLKLEWNDGFDTYEVSVVDEKMPKIEARDLIVDFAKEFEYDLNVPDDSGNIRLYHGTSKEGSEFISKNGFNDGTEQVFVSPSLEVDYGGVNGAGYYGDYIYQGDFDPRDLVFRTEGEFYSNETKKVGNIKIVKSPEKTTRKSTVVTTKKSDTSAETAAKKNKEDAYSKMKRLMDEGYKENEDGELWMSDLIEKYADDAFNALKKIGFSLDFNDSFDSYEISLWDNSIPIKEAQEMFVDLAAAWEFPLAENSDGTISMFHGTSEENAKSILEEGFEDGSFFSPSVDKEFGGVNGASYYGDVILKADLDPRDLVFRPEGEFYSNETEKVGNIKLVKSPEKTYDPEREKRIEDSLRKQHEGMVRKYAREGEKSLKIVISLEEENVKKLRRKAASFKEDTKSNDWYTRNADAAESSLNQMKEALSKLLSGEISVEVKSEPVVVKKESQKRPSKEDYDHLFKKKTVVSKKKPTVVLNVPDSVVSIKETAQDGSVKVSEEKRKTVVSTGTKIADHQAFNTRLREGEVSIDEYKSAFKDFVENEAQILEELSKKTKDQLKDLVGGFSKYNISRETKAEAVKTAYSDLLMDFAMNRAVSYGLGSGSLRSALTSLVESTTQESINEFTEKVAKYKEERKERIDSMKKSLENPETLEEFEQLIEIKGIGSLSEEQLARYDALTGKKKADDIRAQKETIISAKVETTGEITETKHTKTGEPLFVVKLADRVSKDVYREILGTAKRLGGWYSSYRVGGAVPGFQFKDKTAAEEFVKATKGERVSSESISERIDQKEQGAAERLRSMADTLESKANESLGKDRLTNTVKRASQASYAESSAQGDIAFAKTMRNIADAIERGEADLLSGIRNKAQIKELESVISVARMDYGRKNSVQSEKWDSIPAEKAITTVTNFPFGMWKEQFQKVVDEGKNLPGFKNIAKSFQKQISSANTDKTYLEGIRAQEAAQLISEVNSRGNTTLSYWVDSYKRLSSLGVSNVSELRALLREYIAAKVESTGVDKVKELERGIVGKKVGVDFFPTPASVSDQMVMEAGIEPGMTVLEPSAGNGNIAEAIQNVGVTPDVAEISSDLRSILEAKGFPVVEHDFMDVNKNYDRIVMNPPFSDNQDIQHLMHAYKLLNPGGRVVSIIGEGAFFRSGSRETAFREWLTSIGATIEKLPDNTFQDKKLLSTTGAGARIVTIDKDFGIYEVPFSVRRLSKSEKEARQAVERAVADAIVPNEKWDKIIWKIGRTTADFEDYGAISDLRDKIKKDVKSIDHAEYRNVYEILGSRFRMSLGDAVMREMYDEVYSVERGSDPLYAEALKYKSAEEFVKKQPVVYHGSSSGPLERFDNKKGGAFFTEEYADATGYAGDPDNVYEGFLNFKKPLVIDAKGAKWDNLNTKFGKTTQEIVGNAEKAGYDGVTFKNIVDNVMDTEGVGKSTVHYAIKPEDAFVNESQLTDIWNEAHSEMFRTSSSQNASDGQAAQFDRGADGVKIQLLGMKIDGKLSAREYEGSLYILDKIAPLIKSLGMYTGGEQSGGVSGAGAEYIQAANIVHLYNNVLAGEDDIVGTFFHEVGHHLEKYIPEGMANEIRAQFAKERAAALKKNPEMEGKSVEWFSKNEARQELYKYRNVSEYLAESFRELSERDMSENDILKNGTAKEKATVFLKRIFRWMVRSMRIHGSISDRVYSKLISGKELKESRLFGVNNGGATIEQEIQYRANIIYESVRAYGNLLSKEKQVIIENMLDRGLLYEDYLKASDMLIRSGAPLTTFRKNRRAVSSVSRIKNEITDTSASIIIPERQAEFKETLSKMSDIVVAEVEMAMQLNDMPVYFDEREHQYDAFVKLFQKYPQAREVLTSSDTEGIKDRLERVMPRARVDDIFYSNDDDLYADDILKDFRDTLSRQNPNLFYGTRYANAAGYGQKGSIRTAISNLERGGSSFSEEYKTLDTRLKEIQIESKGFQDELSRQVAEGSLDMRKANLIRLGLPASVKTITKVSKVSAARLEKAKAREYTAGVKKGFNIGAKTGQEAMKNVMKSKILSFNQKRAELLAYAKKNIPVELRGQVVTAIGGAKTNANIMRAYEKINTVRDAYEKAQIAEKEYRRKQKELLQYIRDREFEKTENLREVMKLPPITKMTEEQMQLFFDTLSQYEQGDTFLSKRTLETIQNTELKGMKTTREVRVDMTRRTGQEIFGPITVGWTDSFSSDTTLSEKNAFMKLMTEMYHSELIVRETDHYNLKDEVNRLFAKARKSRPRTLKERLIPTDKRIFDFLEADNKEELMADMTKEEIAAAMFVQEKFQQFYDSGVQSNILGGSRFEGKYVPHIHRSFSEAFAESGLKAALAEMSQATLSEEKAASIIAGGEGQSTRKMIAFEKYFGFKEFRSGEMDPSKNVAKALLIYAKAYGTKQALDAITPRLMAYEASVRNTEETDAGLLVDPRLGEFVKEWMNNKKGRGYDFGGKVPQFGIVNKTIHALMTLTRIIDLGLTVSAPISNIGEQGMNYTMLGEKKYALGIQRALTKKGRDIAKKYKGFTGENPWMNLNESTDTVASSTQKVMFAEFGASAFRANRQFLLASMTKSEYESGEISKERLAEIRLKMGRWRMVHNNESIVGSAPVAKSFMQYKTWALPILRATISNSRKILLDKSPGKQATRAEQMELVRAFGVLSMIGMLIGSALDDEDEENGIVQKAIRDLMSASGVLNPTLWLALPRIASFVSAGLVGVGTAAYGFGEQVSGVDPKKSQALYKVSKKGEYTMGDNKGVKQLQRTFTPRVVVQWKDFIK